MYCAKCGKSIPDDSVFCPECGYNLGKAASAVSHRPGAEPVISETMNIGIIVGSVILPLIGIVMGTIYLRDGNPDKNKAGKIWLAVGIGAAVVWLLVKVA